MDELITRVPVRPVLWPGVAVVAAVLVVGSLLGGVLHQTMAESGVPGVDLLVDILDLNMEASAGTWFSEVVLYGLVVMTGLFGAHARDRSERQAWWLLGGLLLLVSIDEITTVHEHLSGLIEERLEVDKALWVVPVAAVLVLFIVVLARLLARTPDLPRLQVVAGLGLLGAGALGMELLSGSIGGRADGWEYWLQSSAEEGLELAGLAVLARSVVTHMTGRRLSLSLRTGLDSD